jgi:hypothetical protein
VEGVRGEPPAAFDCGIGGWGSIGLDRYLVIIPANGSNQEEGEWENTCPRLWKQNGHSERHFGLAINEPAIISSEYMRL